MQHHRSLPRRAVTGLLAGLALALLVPGPARAQATLTADAGLGGFYKPLRWLPAQVTLTNQGAPARVEVRARLAQGMEATPEYRLPERELQSGANQVHTLYLKSPMAYGSQTLAIELFKDGRQSQRRPYSINRVDDGDWLVVGVGSGESTLKLLTTVRLNANQAAPGMAWQRGGRPPQVNVATLEPARVPDRWQGLEAADLVVLADVSERDLTAEQQAALRDYVVEGGTLVVTGGVNARRLATGFFAGLLPVTVSGTQTVSGLPALRAFAGSAPPAASFAMATAAPKPGAEVLVSNGGMPVVARSRRGLGRVVFIAFDPSRPPFTFWSGTRDFWKQLLVAQSVQHLTSPVIPAIQASESVEAYSGNIGPGQVRLADAPYAISQLDIPAFYVVALFLLAYIIVLVPLNYYFLKARDKKEYAWLTTPAIVALFSVGAYLIGYGFKGGRTLLVKVGVIETRSGEESAPTLTYAGLFSPRKTGYDLQLAGQDPSDPGSTLLSEPFTRGSSGGLRVVQDDVQKVEDFGVDMWAMRVLKTEGVTRMGRGITVRVKPDGSGPLVGTVTNDSPFNLEDCYLVGYQRVVPLGALERGKTARIAGAGTVVANRSAVLPAELLDRMKGSREEQRMKRAVLQPLCSPTLYTPYNGQPTGWQAPQHPILVGWVREPVARLQVNGGQARENAATLMIVHAE